MNGRRSLTGAKSTLFGAARRILLFGLSACMLTGLLSGCGARAAAPLSEEPVPGETVSASAEPGESSAEPLPVDARTNTPGVASTEMPPPAVTPETQPTPIRAGSMRPPSGWTIFNNPDYVHGIAVHGDQVWAATGGGVVAWDLKTGRPTLYTTRDGLAEIHASDIAVCAAPQERVIISHPSGMLSVYDLTLKKWSRMSITFADGGTLVGVRALLCDSLNSRLLVGAPGGLGILNEKTGVWRLIGAAEGLSVDSIRAIDVVGQTIWVAAGDKSAFMILGSTIFPFNSASGFPSGSVNDLSVAPDSSIWFGYSTGLVHYREKKWNAYGGQSPSGIPFLSVDHVEVGPDKHVWIASAGEGACPFDTARLSCSTVYPGVRGASITDLVVGPDDTAYAATNGAGVLVLGLDDVKRLAFDKQQLQSNSILDVAQDVQGKMWVATDRGINVFDPRQTDEPWRKIATGSSELPFSRVSGLLPVMGGMWFTYDQEPQATYFDGKTWFQLDASKGMSGTILDTQVDQRGYIWFATDVGIKVWDGALLRTYTPLEELPGNVYYSLHADRDGMWVGSQRGLLRYERFQWRMVLPEIPIHAISVDPDGALLLGTNRGLVRYDGNQSYLWIINLGKETVTDAPVTSITRDGAGSLWVGTAGKGLFKFDGKDWEQFNTSNGLPTNNVRKLITDRLGEVWIIAATDEGGALIRYMP